MAKNLAKVTNACDAKTESIKKLSEPWVIYNPNSSNYKVLYSVNGSLDGHNAYYGGCPGSESDCGEFQGCGSGSGSGSGNG